jgi:hypothetical protein
MQQKQVKISQFTVSTSKTDIAGKDQGMFHNPAQSMPE